MKMGRHLKFVIFAALLARPFFAFPADDATGANAGKPVSGASTNANLSSIEQLVDRIKPSVVVISHHGRDGNVDGIGSGFVVSPDGLIATCLHVIGEGRLVTVQFSDGRRFEVTGIQAWDRKLDLAVIRVNASHLAALSLGDSDALPQGAQVLAVGNPLGLEMSVVQGVVSARRTVEGQPMIQLAMPIEQGNSGGPLLDRFGHVEGLLTLKSSLTPNLGFAMPVNALKLLLNKPNPVSTERWLAFRALDPSEWSTVMGAHWSQRAGYVSVDGMGEGWGGRALCLAKAPAPSMPFEVSVWVKLADEQGAAGLTFGSDGDQLCYGFYPTDGRLRLTRFGGPSVERWSILHETRTSFYRPGTWNWLKVRIETGKLACFINGRLIFESDNPRLAGDRVGLCKFRDSNASFKNFKIGSKLADESSPPSAELTTLIEKVIHDLPAKSEQDAARDLQTHADESRLVLMDRARDLETKAAQLRRVAIQTHRQAVLAELSRDFRREESQIDLFRSALLVAKLDNPDLDVDACRQQAARMAAEIAAALPQGATESVKLGALKHYLFEENGFHTSPAEDFDRSSCYLNEVLDNREGWPIMLSIIYLELAGRIHLDHVVGLPVPGRFMVAYRPAHGKERVLDVSDGGRELDRKALAALITEPEEGDGPASDQPFPPATKKETIVRVLNNLFIMTQRTGEPLDGLHYLDAILVVAPDSTFARLNRARLRIQSGDVEGAKADYRWFMDHESTGVDLDAIGRIYESL